METITITWGEENFMPFSYQGFRLGSISVTVQKGPAETYADVYARVWPQLEELGNKMFVAKRNGFHERFLAKN